MTTLFHLLGTPIFHLDDPSGLRRIDFAYQVQSKFLFERGEIEAANIAAEKALKFNSKNGPATGMRMLCLVEANDLKQAVNVFAAASDELLDCRWAIDLLVERMGQEEHNGADLSTFPLDTKEIIECFLDLLSTEERDLHRARLYDLAGFQKQARELLEGVGNVSNRNQTALDKRIKARLLLKLGLLGLGRQLFRDVIKDSDISLELRERLQGALNFLSDFEESGFDPIDHRLKTPEAVFSYVVSRSATRVYAPVPGRVALIGATLACGGAERVLATAYTALRDNQGVNPQLWLYSSDSTEGHDYFQRVSSIGDEEIRLIPPRNSTVSPFCLMPTEIAVRAYPLYRAFLDERPAVVHGWQDSVNLEAGLAALLAGVPKIILHPHNLRPTTVHRTSLVHTYRACYRALLRSERVHLLCVSEASLRDYEAWLGMSLSEQGHVIANGFEFALAGEQTLSDLKNCLRAQFGLPVDAFVVGSAFRFAAVKRPLLWIDTIDKLRLKIPKLKAILFGDGEMRPEMERRIERLGLGDIVQLVGRIEDVPVALAAIDVCLLTSRTEALPSVIIEAQVAGVPVVAPKVGGVGECLVDGITGVLCNDHSPKSFALAVLRIAAEPEWRTAAAATARDHALGKFGLNRMVRSLVRLYRISSPLERSVESTVLPNEPLGWDPIGSRDGTKSTSPRAKLTIGQPVQATIAKTQL